MEKSVVLRDFLTNYEFFFRQRRLANGAIPLPHNGIEVSKKYHFLLIASWMFPHYSIRNRSSVLSIGLLIDDGRLIGRDILHNRNWAETCMIVQQENAVGRRL
ncbi:hypothetical protein PMAYCL1PPCAC_18015 [Pristionchus mayeri]|uniref:Uncharacterized protein n=2 Tax=Pristionchus mayeri TaxID=1317129 RepID=A0AAN5I167_9BILA|nr:hypothetical protein PMAYCL1PPCAC_18015 [Pristionchus mayeri]